MYSSRTRVGLVAPCIGVGGGDALMLGLTQYCKNIEFTGIAIGNPIEVKHLSWAQKASHNLPPLHTKSINLDQEFDCVQYHPSYAKSIDAAIHGADILMTWCVHSFDRNIPSLYEIPYIEYIQNVDDHAESVVKSNLGMIDFYAACSEAASDLIPDTHKKHVIYNGIDPGRIAPKLGRQKQREFWKLQDKKILLYMGRFVNEKHPELAVHALQHLSEEWVTVFVGQGYKDTELYKLAQQLYPNRVYFIDSQFHVGDVLAAADVFILPSDFEGHSLALCEAWLAGTPTVYTDFKAIDELEDRFGPLGQKIPRLTNPIMVAGAVIDASTQEDYITKNARSVVWENFTLPTIANQWEEYFDYCLFTWRKQKRTGRIHITKPQKLIEKAH